MLTVVERKIKEIILEELNAEMLQGTHGNVTVK